MTTLLPATEGPASCSWFTCGQVLQVEQCKCSPSHLLSAAERRGTPVLLSASVSDNSSNSPQIAAMFTWQRIRWITFMIIWIAISWCGRNDSNFNKSSSFSSIVCGKGTFIGAAIFILTLNHADVIGANEMRWHKMLGFVACSVQPSLERYQY